LRIELIDDPPLNLTKAYAHECHLERAGPKELLWEFLEGKIWPVKLAIDLAEPHGASSITARQQIV